MISREVEALLGPDTGHTRLRQALAALGLDGALPRLSEHEVAAALTPHVVSGRVLLSGDPAPMRLLAMGSKPVAAPAPAPAAARRATVPTAPEPLVAAAVELDVAAMVQTLIDAARDGVPFCEECARAAAAAAAAG